MIAISAKKKTLISLPANLMARGKQVASNHLVTFSDYVAQLLSTDLAERSRAVLDKAKSRKKV
jgi:hypothetical protein